jgi:ABC-type transport system involved in cytochrome bd biosynthesis fused ATPase/permease subunit
MGGSLEFPRAFAVLLLTPECFAPLRTLATRYHAQAAARESMAGIEALLGEARLAELRLRPVGRIGGAVATNGGPSIAFERVTVTFDGRERPALSEVSFDVARHRLTVLAGPTGSGKSTVLHLLLRFFDPGLGHIAVDGADLMALDAVAWRRSIAWSSQQPHLFSGSVRDNLQVGKPDATDLEMRLALVSAAAEDVVEGLPDGLNTIIGSGGRGLSGGQRQRLAIARALVRDAAVLILDEPTSHLDPARAARIRATILERRERQTVVVASHDPELIGAADRVVRLVDGRIVEAPVRDDGPRATLPALAGMR